MGDEKRVTGPTDVENRIKDKFQKSGNMARILGNQTAPAVSDAADQNAENAQEAVRRQDEQLRGTSLREEPSTQQEQETPSAETQATAEPEEELIPKSTFLKRVAKEVERRRKAEEKLEALEQQEAPVQEEPIETPSLDLDGSDPMQQLVSELISEQRETRSMVTAMQVSAVRQEATKQLGDNQELFSVVNEVWKDGTSGLELGEALLITQNRYPEAFEGSGDDGRDGPAYHVESGRSAPSGNREAPKTEGDREKELVNQLKTEGRGANRVALAHEILMSRFSKHKVFGGRPSR